MPLLKIYVDESIGAAARAKIVDALPSLRDLLCGLLGVEPAFCQFSVVAMFGLADQAQVSVEMHILPKPGRTREHLLLVCEKLCGVLGMLVPCKAAVRIATLDPATYVVMR